MNGTEPNRVVLLVEDLDDDAFFFERAFSVAELPHRLVRVTDGGEAVEYLQRACETTRDLTQTHVIFLDLKLPILSGFDVLKWIRDQGIAVEVIVLSGSDIESDQETARLLGAADYLVKPVDAPELRRRLGRRQVASHENA
jgi:CheY-like chemotaxis protein